MISVARTCGAKALSIKPIESRKIEYFVRVTYEEADEKLTGLSGAGSGNLRRKVANPSKAKPSRETVEPASGTPTLMRLTLTSSSHEVSEKSANCSSVEALVAGTENVKCV